MMNQTTILSIINGIKVTHKGEEENVISTALEKSLNDAGIEETVVAFVMGLFNNCSSFKELRNALSEH